MERVAKNTWTKDIAINRRVIVKAYSLDDLIQEQDPTFVTRIIASWKVEWFLSWSYWDVPFNKARGAAIKLCHPDTFWTKINQEVAEILLSAIREKEEWKITHVDNTPIKSRQEIINEMNKAYESFKVWPKTQEDFLFAMRTTEQWEGIDSRIPKMIIFLRLDAIEKQFEAGLAWITNLKKDLDVITEVYGYSTVERLKKMSGVLIEILLAEFEAVNNSTLKGIKKQSTITEIKDMEREYGLDLSEYIERLK